MRDAWEQMGPLLMLRGRDGAEGGEEGAGGGDGERGGDEESKRWDEGCSSGGRGKEV